MHTQYLPDLKFSVSVVAAVAMVFATGCTTLHNVSVSPNAMERQLDRGDDVVVTTANGSVHEFEVTAIGPDTLRGDGTAVPYSDITRVQVKRFDGKKTTLLVVPIVAIAAVAAGGGGGGGGSGGGSGY